MALLALHHATASSHYEDMIARRQEAQSPIGQYIHCQMEGKKKAGSNKPDCDSRSSSSSATVAAAKVCRHLGQRNGKSSKFWQFNAEDSKTRVQVTNVDPQIPIDEAACNKNFAELIEQCLTAVEKPNSNDNPRNMRGWLNQAIANIPGTTWAIYEVGSTKCVKAQGEYVAGLAVASS
ncbi:MAG: hypothetical protein M1825_004765 [Sarcosagium campestre]|nr:MAG: hypothetical protein M1825_004765 [Sarcosagium campestre]